MSDPEGSEFVGIISWVMVVSALIALLTVGGLYGCASAEWNGGLSSVTHTSPTR